MLRSRLTRAAVALLKTAGLQGRAFINNCASPSGNAVDEKSSKSEEFREYYLNL